MPDLYKYDAVLKFPEQADNNVLNYLDLLDNFNQTLLMREREILFNCEDIRFIRPFGVNLLSAMISYHKRMKNKVSWKKPKSLDVIKYLEDQGFFQKFNTLQKLEASKPRTSSVALKQLERIDGTYLDNITEWLCHNGDISLEAARNLVSISLLEVINNVFDHSQSLIGCWISAQAYPRENQLILSILDFGIGFFNSLKPSYPDIKDDVEAINKAVTEGVSSKREAEKRVRGVGLSNISGFLHNRGAMEIISYSGFWKQANDGSISTRFLTCPLRGVCVNLYIDKSSLLNIVDMGEDIWDG